ncbi:UvrD-helicase domain-containing protein [uncultured Croceitalea sp.]|uniref:UvrD-helicase domain-containing protein n=1 Tax=uncultured Croceitalea sp. TaxID=1798908 RepID=UPI00374E58CC
MCNLQAKHLLSNAFKIYSASAGSGKTYQLTKAYLRLILSPFSKQKYRELLAITFTNKAVAEMKERILESLYAFSLDKKPKNKIALFKDMLYELQLTPDELSLKAEKVLKELLHNYAFFEISTIDKFTHKIIRTFARDLKISQGFDVVLDTDLLLEESVGRLLNRAGEDKILTKVLLDFSIEKIEDDKSWNIAYDLFEIGKLLFQENHSTHLKNISDNKIEDFVKLQKALKTKILKSKSIIKELANESLGLITKNELEFADFTRSSFPKFMQGIVENNSKIDFNATWKQNFDINPLYNKTSADSIKNKLDGLHPQFSNLFKGIKKHYYELSFLTNCYKNIVPLTVLNQIAKELVQLQKEKDVLPISEFNSIIAKEIKNQPVPFIYERLGEKYRHYFIDEFQDTSQMQWQNLIPLISNAIEGENEKGERGSLLLVGDAKQAIYRWRGGRAEQFLNLINLTTNPFALEPEVKNLSANWRSKKEIIDFNNSFFTYSAKRLNNLNYKKLFEEGNNQKPKKHDTGYVELLFTTKETQVIEDSYCEKTLEILQRVLHNGYNLKDVCILVRDNKKGTLLADFLTKKEIPLVSSDSLLLVNNSEISFLISILKYLNNSENNEAKYFILEYLFDDSKEYKHDFIIKNLESLPSLLNNVYGFEIAKVKNSSTYDILEQAIANFKLAGLSDAHLAQFMDEVFDFSQKEDSSIFSFLRFWERKKEKLSVKAPESLNAVQIMTVHKAKGLEFPVVIFPYADSKLIDHRSGKLWIPVEEEFFEGFNELLINSNKELANYNSTTEEIYNNELSKLELDAYNVLYVAMTRAKNALFIISNIENKRDTYAELFIDYLKYLGNWNDMQLQYNFGSFDKNEDIKENNDGPHQSIPYTYTQKSDSSFNMVTKSSMLWDNERQEAIQKGNLIHKALSKIYTPDDITNVVASLVDNGDISSSDIPDVKEKLSQIVNHPQLSSYFKEDLIIYNEKELLTPDGLLFIPDRIVIENDKAILIDYKTGAKSETHKNQLKEYTSILEKMNYVVKDMIIVYINETVKPIFL